MTERTTALIVAFVASLAGVVIIGLVIAALMSAALSADSIGQVDHFDDAPAGVRCYVAERPRGVALSCVSLPQGRAELGAQHALVDLPNDRAETEAQHGE